MNRDWYRMAVRSIRFSPEKRAEIEARLRTQSTAQSAPPEGWAETAHDPAEAYSRQTMQMIRTEEYDMKFRRMRKTMLVGLLVIGLATGGAIGAAVSYAKKHPQILNITWKNGITLNLTNEESDEPSTSWTTYGNSIDFKQFITPANSGWFFWKQTPYQSEVNDGFSSFIRNGYRNTLTYADKETGQTATVCARPNCLHDGNAYCTATTETYAPSYLTWHDGWLYTVTTKYLHPENNGFQITVDGDGRQKPEDCKQVLLRYSPDGTEITELADFGNGIGVSKCIIHRGYVWCIAQRQTRGEEIENPITHNTMTFESGGWQLWGYDLRTGQSALIYEAMGDPEINHVNAAPDVLFGAGDYLYFNRMEKDWSGGQGLCRISLLTGEVANGEEENLITGRHMLCHSKTAALRTAEEKNEQKENIVNTYLLDFETLEEKLLFSNKREIDMTAEERQQVTDDPYNVNIEAMDETYIYSRRNRPHEGSTEKNMEADVMIALFDYEGKLIKEIDTGFDYKMKYDTTKDREGNYFTEQRSDSYSILAVHDGLIYMGHATAGWNTGGNIIDRTGKNEVLYCSVDELLNSENPEWKFAYTPITESEEAENDAE